MKASGDELSKIAQTAKEGPGKLGPENEELSSDDEYEDLMIALRDRHHANHQKTRKYVLRFVDKLCEMQPAYYIFSSMEAAREYLGTIRYTQATQFPSDSWIEVCEGKAVVKIVAQEFLDDPGKRHFADGGYAIKVQVVEDKSQGGSKRSNYHRKPRGGAERQRSSSRRNRPGRTPGRTSGPSTTNKDGRSQSARGSRRGSNSNPKKTGRFQNKKDPKKDRGNRKPG